MNLESMPLTLHSTELALILFFVLGAVAPTLFPIRLLFELQAKIRRLSLEKEHPLPSRIEYGTRVLRPYIPYFVICLLIFLGLMNVRFDSLKSELLGSLGADTVILLVDDLLVQALLFGAPALMVAGNLALSIHAWRNQDQFHSSSSLTSDQIEFFHRLTSGFLGAPASKAIHWSQATLISALVFAGLMAGSLSGASLLAGLKLGRTYDAITAQELVRMRYFALHETRIPLTELQSCTYKRHKRRGSGSPYILLEFSGNRRVNLGDLIGGDGKQQLELAGQRLTALTGVECGGSLEE